MGTGESKMKALHQSEILIAHAPWEMGRLISDASKQRSKLGFFLRQTIID
jgi:hypothetical protein